MCDWSAIAIEAQVIVLFACEALESISFDGFHPTLVTSYIFVHVALQVELCLHLFDQICLLSYLFPQYLFVRSQHFNFSSKRCYTIVVIHFTLLEYFLASSLAHLCLKFANWCMILHEVSRSDEIAALVWTQERIEEAAVVVRFEFPCLEQFITAIRKIFAFNCHIVHHIANYTMHVF